MSARRDVRLGAIPAAYGVIVAIYLISIVGAFFGVEWMLATGSIALIAAGFAAPVIGGVGGFAMLVLAAFTLWRATRLQPGTRGRGRLATMATAGIVQLFSAGAVFGFAMYLAANIAMPAFGGPIDPRELLLPLSGSAEIGFWVALASLGLSFLVLLGSAISAWFLTPVLFRRVFFWITDTLTAIAFVPVAIGSGALTIRILRDSGAGFEVPFVYGIRPDVVLRHLPEPLPVEVQAVALAVAVLFALRAALRLLPPGLDLVERLSFGALVAARHLRADKSGFLTFIGMLSILAVALSSCALTTTLSVMGGFRNDLKRKILGNNAHVVVDVEHGTFAEWQRVVRTARRTDGVLAAAPYVSGEVMVTSASNLAGAVLRGIDPSRASDVIDLRANLVRGRLEYLEHPERLLDLPPDEALGPYPMDIPTLDFGDDADEGADGEPPDDPSVLEPPILPEDPTAEELVELLGSPTPIDSPREVLPGIIVGQELARALRLYVGDEVNVVSPLGDLGPAGPMPKSRPFRVAGIFYSGMYEYDMKYTYIVLDTAQRFLNVGNRITGVEVKVEDVDRAPVVAAALRERLADAGRGELRVQDWQQVNSTLFGALELERLAMFIFLGIAILVAGFCVFGTLTLMVQEKSGQTGILKAMGARSKDIVALFLIEGLLIGILGAALGLGLGYVACFTAEHFGIRMNPEVYYIDKLPVHINGGEFGLVGLAAVVVCVVATIFPAVLASEVRPVDALRYE